MIDPDRDYLLAKVIQLQCDYDELNMAHNHLVEQWNAILQLNQNLTEANAQALANAEGWKQQVERWKKDYFEMLDASHEWQVAYDNLATAARRDSGWKNKRSYLRHLGLPVV